LLVRKDVSIFTEALSTISQVFIKLMRARAGKYLSNGAHSLSLFVTACFKPYHLTELLLFLSSCAIAPNFPLILLAASLRNTPDSYSNAVNATNSCFVG
jgi:hypothetical protein